MFDQKFGDGSIKDVHIQYALFHFFEELKLIFVQVRCKEKGKKMQNQFLFYSYSGNLINDYSADNHTGICRIDNIVYEKKTNIIKISYHFTNNKTKYKSVFDVKNKKFINYEK
jgi:hypothetical protein